MGDDVPSPFRPKRRILIIDEHPLVRRGLTAIIDHEQDLAVCAAATWRTGIETIASCRPDLIITDPTLGDADGLALVQEVRARHGDLPILVLTVREGAIWARRALRAGARGFLSKREPAETVLVAIRSVLDGETYVRPQIDVRHDEA